MDTAENGPAGSRFDPLACTRALLRGLRHGALATLMPDGAPYASLVNVATETAGTPVVLISQLAVHTRNIAADNRVSLLLAHAGDGDPAAHPRVSIGARALPGDDAAMRARFLARHPQAAGYADFSDFAFYRLIPDAFHLVAGFGRIVDLAPEAVLSLPDASAELAAAQEGILASLNGDHGEALASYAASLAWASGGDWRATGIDPEGIDLSWGEHDARITFPDPLTRAADWRFALASLDALAEQVRAKSMAGT